MTETPDPAEPGALADALADLADLFSDGMTAGHIGPHLTCSETDTIARVLRLAGRGDAAATLISGHASEDDDEDDEEHVAVRDADQAKQEAWWDEYTGESAARRILSDAGLTVPEIHVNRTTDGRGAVNIYAPPVASIAEPAPARLARAAELLTARGWTITDGPSAGMRRATQPTA